MKNFLKNDWFKLVITLMLIFGLTIYILKQEEFKICVKTAQQEKEKSSKEVFQAWVENKVSSEWKDQASKDLKAIYSDEIKDCLLIK